MTAGQAYGELALTEDLMEKYEFFIRGEWRAIEVLDMYRHPKSPVFFYRPGAWPDEHIALQRDVLIKIRPRRG